MIRNLEAKDIEKANELGKQLYSNFESIYFLKNYIKDSKYCIFINEDDKINGLLIALENIDEYELLCIVVDKNCRNIGIGSKLMNYFVEKSNKPIILEVSEKNISAINLYQKFGFKEIGIRKNYYKDSNAIIMKLVIE